MKQFFTILLLFAAILAGRTGAHAAPKASEKPNVVLVMSDDMGYSDLPKFGESEIPTPSLDRLANEGTLFTNAYVSGPICVVSRIGLLTGRHQARFGMYGNVYGKEKNRFFLEETLLSEVFQKAGYRTGMVGKWHLSGNGQDAWDQKGPLERGFDEYVAIRGGGSSYWTGAKVFRNEKLLRSPEYLTDFWGTEACEFIDRNKSRPFFLYLGFNAVHSPMHATEDDQAKFPEVKDKNRRIYDGMLLAMDRNIGRILKRLDENGLADNTIVFFLNDNGGGGSTNRYAGHSRNYANNKPLRGHKFDLTEGGIRVPMLVRWPGRIPKDNTYEQMVSSMDIFPTLVKAAGLELPTERTYDGVDLLPFLTGTDNSIPHDHLCWQGYHFLPRGKGGKSGAIVPVRHIHNSAIRKGKWKLLRIGEDLNTEDAPPTWQLYDLAQDIGEQSDVAAENPEVVRDLSQKFDAWRAGMRPNVDP